MLKKELIGDEEMIEVVKYFVRKNINLPGGIIDGFPLTKKQYNASIDRQKKIVPSHIIVLDEPACVADVIEDEKTKAKIQRFRIAKDVIIGGKSDLESLTNIKTKIMYIDCTNRQTDEIVKLIVDEHGPARAEQKGARRS